MNLLRISYAWNTNIQAVQFGYLLLYLISDVHCFNGNIDCNTDLQIIQDRRKYLESRGSAVTTLPFYVLVSYSSHI
jgi:hypothetical protein